MKWVNKNQVIAVTRFLTLSWQRSLSNRNQSIDLLCKSVEWFLCDSDLRHERANEKLRGNFINYARKFLVYWWQNSLSYVFLRTGILKKIAEFIGLHAQVSL